MFHVKHALVGSTVIACLLVSTTFVQAQNSLSISSALDEAISTTAVSLDVTMESDVARHAVSLAISYDDAVVTLSGVNVAGTAADQADWSEGTICNDVGDSGGACTSEGGVVWSIIMGLNSIGGSFDTGAAIPAGTSIVAELDFDTSAMGPGASTNVNFQDGLDLFGVAGKNAIVSEGTGVSASNGLGLSGGTISIAPPPGACCLTEGCQDLSEADCTTAGGNYQGDGTTCGDADICPVGGVFRRGDHDGSGVVDLTDSINRLNFLFLGVLGSTCQDASDFDNSGSVDLTDSINELTHLFLGTVEPPPPGTTNCGTDPTEIVDAGGGLPEQPAVTLGCDSYTACP